MPKATSKMHMYDMVKIDEIVFEIVGEAFRAPPPRIVSCLKYPGSDRVNDTSMIKLIYDTCIENCISDVDSSNKCRMYREIKPVYKCEHFMDCNIRYDLRMYCTKFRLSNHKFLVERARWCKNKIPYHERTCSQCNVHDVQVEYHFALIYEYFK